MLTTISALGLPTARSVAAATFCGLTEKEVLAVRRWGRLVKRAGTAGEFGVGNAPDDRCGDKEEVLAAAAT